MNGSAFAEAIAVAAKLRCRGFASNEAAVRSLKRRCPSLGSNAAQLLSAATEVLRAASLVVETQLPHLFAIYEKTGQVAPSNVASFAPLLARQFPSWPQPALKSALWSAAVYSMR